MLSILVLILVIFTQNWIKINTNQILTIVRFLTLRIQTNIKTILEAKIYTKQNRFFNIFDCVKLEFAQVQQIFFTILIIY